MMETCAFALGAMATRAKKATVQRSAFHPRRRGWMPCLLMVGIVLRRRVAQDGRAIFIRVPCAGVDPQCRDFTGSGG